VKITLSKISKSYNHHRIFNKLDFQFEPGNAYVILGANGSGKSSLLQLIAGSLLPTSGTISYHSSTAEIPSEQIYSYISLLAPYLEIIEAFSLEEIIAFHFQFKEFYPGLDSIKIKEIIGLGDTHHKVLKEFSSGMKQRVKIALNVLCNTPILLLDEPTNNLDKNGIEWYTDLMARFRENRTVIVCSNEQKAEYAFCNKELLIENYK